MAGVWGEEEVGMEAVVEAVEGEGKIVCRQMAPAAVTRHPGPRQPVSTDPFLQTVTTGALILLT